MFRKLAFGNVKKSMKDYTIYFLTMVFGVCLFYVFNSMESQEKMLSLSQSNREIIQMLTYTMGYVSAFISIILGFLILYANRFLIRRRKKELGIYMCLGIDKRKISRMLLYETIAIGLIALMIGIVLGIFGSQGLAVVTAKLMGVQIKQFVFTFSLSAMLKSIVYFGVIFLVVMIFNTITISRYKLIDLLTASRKNEKDRTPKLWLSVLLFVVSMVMIGIAYHMLYDLLERLDLEKLSYLLIIGAVGTILLFYSLSGFVLKVIKNIKGVYFRGINMFVFRQINSKLSSTFISMSIICLMLLVAITTMASGLGFSNVMTKRQDELTPVSISYVYYSPKKKEMTPLQAIEKSGIDLSKEVKGMNELSVYSNQDFCYGQLFDQAKIETDETFSYIKEQRIQIIKLSDYNKEMKFQGEKTLDLQENECAMVSSIDAMRDLLDEYIESGNKVEFNQREFTVKGDLIHSCYYNEMMGNTTGTIILPDQSLEGAKLDTDVRILNMNYLKETDALNRELENKMDDMFEFRKAKSTKGFPMYAMYMSRQDIATAKVGIRVVASFFILYVGIIFLISCAAILALQQLTESSDNVVRYQLLRKLGVEDGMMKKALFTQIGIYFMVPLLIAIIHSFVAIRFSSKLFTLLGEPKVGSNVFMVALFIIVIYGGYFLATYIGSKNIIKEK